MTHCPTCAHKMDPLATGTGQSSRVIYWCPRCGTRADGVTGRPAVPQLVGRCRKILDGVPPGEWIEVDAGTLDRLGIAECIRPPAGGRP